MKVVPLWSRKAGAAAALPEIKLEGFRVLLRPPGLRDYPDWVHVRRKNRDYLKPFEPTWAENALTHEFFIRRLQQQSRDWREGRAHSFLIFEKGKGDLIGGVNINHVCRGAAQSASLGYWLSEESQGQGLMAESLRLVVGFAFSELKLHRLNAACLPGNGRSRALLTKIGFRQEGFAESYIQIDGKWRDHVLYGLANIA